MRNGYHPEKRAGKKDGLKEQGFYHWPVWRRLRLKALQRDHYLCQLRLSKKCTGIATEVHHIEPIDERPDLALELSNLASACWQCHELTKRRGKGKQTARVRVISIRDGSEESGSGGDQ